MWQQQCVCVEHNLRTSQAFSLWWPNQVFSAKTQCFPNPNQVILVPKPQVKMEPEITSWRNVKFQRILGFCQRLLWQSGWKPLCGSHLTCTTHWKYYRRPNIPTITTHTSRSNEPWPAAKSAQEWPEEHDKQLKAITCLPKYFQTTLRLSICGTCQH